MTNSQKSDEEDSSNIEKIGTTGKSVITHMPEDESVEGMVELGCVSKDFIPALTYPATITQVKHMSFVANFRDLPHIHPTGTDIEEARADAVIKLEEVLLGYFADNTTFRYPSPALPNEYPIPVSEVIATKMAAYCIPERR